MNKQQMEDVENVARVVSEKLVEMVKDNAQTAEIAKTLFPMIMRYYLKEALLYVLTEYKDLNLSPQAASDYTTKSFGTFKYDIQKEIAVAFELAMQEFKGGQEPALYLCSVIPVREPINKKPA